MRLSAANRLTRVLVCLAILGWPALCPADTFSYDGRQALTTSVPGAFVGLSNSSGSVLWATSYDMFGNPSTYYSYVAVLDTGASASLLSAKEATARSLPPTGDLYDDVGIGGSETLYASNPMRLKLASVATGYAGSENQANFTVAPDTTFRVGVRQTDPFITQDVGFGEPMQIHLYTNVVGTPVINRYVMHVKPNGQSFPHPIDELSELLGEPATVPVNFMETDLLSAAPAAIHANSGELVLIPTAGGLAKARHVPLTYTDFTNGTEPATMSTNPTITDVHISVGDLSSTDDWLFDTGATVTMVSRAVAIAAGIDLGSTPVAHTTVIGLGGATRTINGYYVDDLVVPLTGTDQLAFPGAVVFVPGADDPLGDLPAGLSGIFGMNLINDSFSNIVANESGGYTVYNQTPSAFNDWYVVPGAAVTAPEPGSLVLLTICAAAILLRRFVRRRR
jgi:hypothetical protein